MLWERHIIPQDIRKRSIAVLSLERRGSEEHLVNQYAQRPPIDRTGMSTAFDNLRRNVLLRTDKRVRSEIVYAGFRIDRW